MSLEIPFSVTKREMVPLLIVNARLRRAHEISRKPAYTVAELASARQHQENPADHHGARGGG